MFPNLSRRLTASINKLRGIRRLTKDNIQSTLHEIRKALLEADVALRVADDFISVVKKKFLGKKIRAGVASGRTLVKIVQDELTTILGGEQTKLSLPVQKPVVILIVGLQGAGKTTSVAKLAHWLKTREKKSVMVVSTDVYRPAAVNQLQMLAKQAEAHCFPTKLTYNPVDIAQAAIAEAKKKLLAS